MRAQAVKAIGKPYLVFIVEDGHGRELGAISQSVGVLFYNGRIDRCSRLRSSVDADVIEGKPSSSHLRLFVAIHHAPPKLKVLNIQPVAVDEITPWLCSHIVARLVAVFMPPP
jgi:hypothetical protein